MIVLQRISSRTKQFSLEWENLPDINHKYVSGLAKQCIAYFYNLQLSNFLKERHTGDRKALIIKIGDEVASRNGYIKNDYLSMLNSRKQRSMRAVYSKLRKSPTYLSLDFESGGFEVFDKNGLHLGQYSFDGARTKVPAPDTHKLYFS